ncbi:MAG: hypothetical protein ACOWWM_14795 [Desulfobacterales bacterium]
MLHLEWIILPVVAFGLAQIMLRVQPGVRRYRPATTEDYLYKISRVTGKSEYDIFCKSAEAWPVSIAAVNEDFKDYLTRDTVPYYVNDFIRKNKDRIDALRLPPL